MSSPLASNVALPGRNEFFDGGWVSHMSRQDLGPISDSKILNGVQRVRCRVDEEVNVASSCRNGDSVVRCQVSQDAGWDHGPLQSGVALEVGDPSGLKAALAHYSRRKHSQTIRGQYSWTIAWLPRGLPSQRMGG